jgi:hypothetical protein
VKPIVLSADLKYVLRQMKLSPMLDTLPERIALARKSRMSYQDFFYGLGLRRPDLPT